MLIVGPMLWVTTCWLLAATAVGIIATLRERSGFWFFVVAIVFSPLIGLIILLATKGPSKRCPRCAEGVKPDARVCRYCGHEFGTEQATAS